MIDSRDLNELHPAVKRAAHELIARMKKIGYEVLVTSTFRDMERQNALYAQGRSTPGKIVTNAKAGESIHNYRLAFDICKNVKGQEFSDKKFFNEAGRIGMEIGLEWGGSWIGFVDAPHFQFTAGLSTKNLKSGAVVPANVKLKWENDSVPSKEAEEVVDKVKILYNNKEIEVDRIMKEGNNFVRLRDLEKCGISIGYDEEKKMPIVTH